ncbi:MAG: Mth938-like domain-containing protein [Gammaproteobacteria bacterium]
MQLKLESGNGIYVRSFSPGELRIDDRILTEPVILTPEKIIADWRPPPLDQLSIDDFGAALAAGPEVILLGTGIAQTFPPVTLMTDIMRAGIGFEVMATAAACRTFNVLASEGRKIAAALIV